MCVVYLSHSCPRQAVHSWPLGTDLPSDKAFSLPFDELRVVISPECNVIDGRPTMHMLDERLS